MGHHRLEVFRTNGVCPTIEALANLSFVGILRCCHAFLKIEVPLATFQRDSRRHESLDEEACSRSKVPAFRGGEHNILAAFIQVIQTLPRRHEIRAPFSRYIRFAHPFESL